MLTNFFRWSQNNQPIIIPLIIIVVIFVIVCSLLADISAKTRVAMMEEISGETADEDAYNRVRVNEQIFRSISLISHVLAMYIAGMWLWQLFCKDKISNRLMVFLLVCSEVIFAAGWLVTAPLILLKGSIHASWSLAPLVGLTETGFLYFALSRLTLFFFAQLILIGEGLTQYGGYTRARSYTQATGIMLAAIVITLPLNIIFNLVFAGLMATFGK